MVAANRKSSSDCDVLDLHALRRRRSGSERVPFRDVDTFEGVASDPITLHKYLYANANPVTYTDPTGMFGTGELSVGMGIMVLLNVLMFPNVANAPGPDDMTIGDRGGDMAVGAVLSVPVAAGVHFGVRFVVSPLVRWGSTQLSKLFNRPAVLTTRLYRVVSEAEYAHITQTGKMLPDPTGRGYQTGKWFWRKPEAAQKWADQNPGFYGNGYRVIAADVPPEITATALQAANLDQFGDAVFLEIDDLLGAAIKEAAR